MSNNDEARMTNDGTTSNAQMTNVQRKRSAAFGFRHSFVIRHSAFVIFLALAVPTDAAPAPSAKEILDLVRLLESRQQIDLVGRLRHEEKVILFLLTQTGQLDHYNISVPIDVLTFRCVVI